MTKGQFLIGNFNPNEDVGVDRIKALATELIDEIDSSTGGYTSYEVKNLCEQACLLVLQAQMLAVKAIHIDKQD